MNLELEYQRFLEHAGLDERSMTDVQSKYTKKIFFFTVGFFLEKISEDIGKMTDDEAVEELEDIRNQVLDFLFKQL